MLISLKLLNKYVYLSEFTPQQIAEKISSSGLEVEEIRRLAYGTNLVIGQIKELRKHPQSDHLNLLKVDIGSETLDIVCGASNVRENAKVIVAKENAYLKAIDTTIKKSTIRGEKSEGMCCSLLELGVEQKNLSQEEKEGIKILDDEAIIGQDPLEYLELDDVLFDISLTPNRGDCMSIQGLVIDIAAILGKKSKLEDFDQVKTNKKSSLEIEIKTDNCEVFSLRKIEGIKVSESPYWLQNILFAHGIKPINNIVDLGNYVMLMTGQPIHIYDANKVKSNKFIIKDDMEQSVKMLDENVYEIKKDDIVITNNNVIECVGGVMGSYSSMIDENTTNIIVEAASFKSSQVRLTSQRLNLQSESSQRFVKEIDKYATKQIIEYLTSVLAKISTFTTIEETVSLTNNLKVKQAIELPYIKVEKVLGFKISKEDIESIFDNLYFKKRIEKDIYKVYVPSRRNDLQIAEDLIEEIVRIYGFDQLKSTIPVNSSNRGYYTDKQLKRERIKNYLINNGLFEVVSYSLVSKKGVNKLNYLIDSKEIELLNPLTEDRKYLRKSLAHSLLSTISYNKSKGNRDIAIFENSKVYSSELESEFITVALNGNFKNVKWINDEKMDYYFIKGILEGILKELFIDTERVSIEYDNKLEDLHPYQSGMILIDKKVIGYIGKVHPKVSKEYDLDDTYILEMNLDKLFELKSSKIKFSKLNTFPSSSRDISMIVDRDIISDKIIKFVKKQNRELIKDVIIFDVYQGENIDDNKKSIALSIIYQDSNKTMTDDEVNNVHRNVLESIIKQFDAIIR